ncbi:hypothetical protein RRG08_056049 [Elysia crispata]|uniref:GAIN-B domain-containing protein n=1 Tax=Elysia crispata TaxID=231223 RepID=A0AAE0ZN31_9GAST|nr:hypothetical protein RRG08_056049 [Elysia crispata]
MPTVNVYLESSTSVPKVATTTKTENVPRSSHQAEKQDIRIAALLFLQILIMAFKLFHKWFMLNIDKEVASKVGKELRNLTVQVEHETVTETDVVFIVDTLQKVTSVEEELPPSTIQDILDTVNEVSQFPESSLQAAQNLSDATNRILHTTDKLGALLQIEEDQTHKRIVSGGFGLEVWDIDKQAPDNETAIGIKVLKEGEETEVDYDQLVTQFSYANITYNNTEAAIYLPKGVIKSYVARKDNPKVRLVMNVYKDTSLYRQSVNQSVEGQKVNTVLNSRIIAAQLLVEGRQIRDLKGHKVVIVLEPTVSKKPNQSSEATSCAFWDFSADESRGNWNTSGCIYEKTVNGKEICECNHLTNFAVLVSYYDQTMLEHKEALGYITIVGLSLSIVGLTIPILSFLCIKKLRQGRPQQITFQLSIALLLSFG